MSRTEDAVINKLYLKYALDQLDNDYERLLFILNLLGWNQRQLAAAVGCSHQNISIIIRDCKRKIKERVINA